MVFVRACMHVRANMRVRVCVHARMSAGEGECVCVCSFLWCWASCSDPTECTILSANKGPAVPPHFNRGLLQHRRPFAAELTKYFSSCSEFVSINSFMFWGFLSPPARRLWWKTPGYAGGHVISDGSFGPATRPGGQKLNSHTFTSRDIMTLVWGGAKKNHPAVQQDFRFNVQLTSGWFRIILLGFCPDGPRRGIEKHIVLQISLTECFLWVRFKPLDSRVDRWLSKINGRC